MASTLSLDVLSKYPNPVFIETGTLNGDGVKLALACGFKRIYSIDIDLEIVLRNAAQFLEYGEQVRILHGDSFEVLQTLLPTIHEPVTFWLDGHWEMGAQGKYRCPLLHEMDVIAQHPIKTHTILVDDRRVFGLSNHHWGGEVTEEAVMKKIRAINPDYKITYETGYQVPPIPCNPEDIIVASV